MFGQVARAKHELLTIRAVDLDEGIDGDSLGTAIAKLGHGSTICEPTCYVLALRSGNVWTSAVRSARPSTSWTKLV